MSEITIVPEAAPDVRGPVDNTHVTEFPDGTATAPTTDEVYRAKTSVNHDSTLGAWFKRPVLIYTQTWAEGMTFQTTFDPWDLYLNNPNIRRKLAGFGLFRGSLKIKFLINATPFQYSCVLVSYKPLTGTGGENEELDFSGGTAYAMDPPSDNDVTALAKVQSLRNPIYLYPSKCQGGEMHLPFVWPNEWRYLPYAQADGALPFSLGKIAMRALDPLRTVGTAGEDLTIQVFAWMDDIELTAPTITTAELQGWELNATSIKDIASIVSNTPWIPPFAKVASRVVGGAASVAAALGFTKHNPVYSLTPVMPVGTQNFSLADVTVNTDKLALLSTTELSIDPRYGQPDGLDHMNFRYIMSKEMLVNSFLWDTTDTGDLSWIAVSPMMLDVQVKMGASGVNTYRQIQLSHIGHIASCFRYWRGSIKYRFVVVKTPYHKGRLVVTHDPRLLTSSQFDYTLQESSVFDITENEELTLKIGMMTDTYWKEVQPLVTAVKPFVAAPGFLNAIDTNPIYINGCVRVGVMNKLSAPVAMSTVRVLVYASSDDMEFAEPVPLPGGGQTTFNDPFVYQSLVKEVDNNTENSKVDVGAYMGETVGSAKTLMQRMALLTKFSGFYAAPGTSATAKVYLSWVLPRLPWAPITADAGSVPGNSYYHLLSRTGFTVQAGNYMNMSHYNWFTAAFASMRGSIEWRVLADNMTTDANSATMSVYREPYPVANAPNSWLTIIRNPFAGSQGDTIAATSAQYINSTPEGGGVVIKRQIPDGFNANFVAPCYSKNRFLPGNAQRQGQTTPGISDDRLKYVINSVTRVTNIPSLTDVSMYYAAGADFRCLWYINPPTIFFTSATSTAS